METAHVETISSAHGIDVLDTSNCERWLKINGGEGITGDMKSKCTNISPETSA